MMMIIFLFIIGTMAGSFMNVCIYRMPRKQSIVTPPSRCPSCGARIPWFDNVPILSFLILRGKCRFCKKRISARYIIVEALSGFICVLLFLYFGLTAKFFILWFLLSALIVASFIDLRFHEIPDIITLPGIILGLLLAGLYPPLMGKTGHLSSLLNSLLGILAGGGSIYLAGFIGEFIFKKEAMGGGDVKLLAMIGSFIGWKLAIFTFFLAPFFGSLVGITLKIKHGREIIPYGPHLSLAALVAILYGEQILRKLFFI
ncbi:MAG: prepilin peptidase [Candidatus Omnitrophota bacterium]|nr:MAG: prepilin peptidase [Candidatus Omnitrophota bacterium]